jgi:hypothetical protein
VPNFYTKRAFGRAPALSVQEMRDFAAKSGCLCSLLIGENTSRVAFVAPLPFAPTLNQLAEMPGWQRKKLKDQCGRFVFAQIGKARAPFKRAEIRAVRFSARAPDHDAAWTKIPVDRLVEFGWLPDDNPGHVLSLSVSWVKAPPGKGFVFVEASNVSAR